MTVDTAGSEVTTRDRDIVVGRANGMGAILHRTNLLLGAKSDGVITVHDQRQAVAPAWTDGKTIWINGSPSNKHVHEALNKGWNKDSTLTVTALNYHELAHVMFTPRVNGDLAQRVRSFGMWHAFNVLEDQRAESLFVGLYNPARSYFTRLVSKYLRDSKEQVEGNYALVAGRKFLPVDLRAFFRGQFRDSGMLADIDAITSEYIALEYPTQDDRGFELIRDFHALLTGMTTPPAGQGDHSRIDGGSGEGVRKQRQAAADIDQQGEDVTDEDVERVMGSLSDEDDTDEQDEVEDFDASGGDGDEQGEAAGDGDEDSDAAPGGSSSSDEDEADPDGDGHGSGGGDTDTDGEAGDLSSLTDKEVEDLLDRLLDRTDEEADDDIRDEVERRADTFEDAMGTVESDFGYCQYEYVAPPTNYVTAARKMERQWKRIKDMAAPDWEYPVRHGQRLDTRRAMRAERTGDRDLFRKWQDGARDVNDFEAVLLLDTSSSMRDYWGGPFESPIGAASASLWATHRALTKVGADVTALTFSDDAKDLIKRGEKPDARGVKVARASGWTAVTDAFRAALRTLKTSKRSQRFVMIFTDGEFTDRWGFEPLLKQCEYDVIIVGIGNGVNVKQWESYDAVAWTQRVESADELADATKDIVSTLSQRWVEKGR